MNGTEKQIKWASEIKAEKMNDLKVKCENMIKTNQSAPADQIEKIKNQLESGLKAMSENEDSKFWIDNRSEVSGKIAKMLLNK